MTVLDVGAALDPLYRAYLRRLDEMASRLPAGSLLREATARGPDGSVSLGTDGLPVIFDVADEDTGETFEVRGAAPDEPAAASGLVGALEVELLPGNWEALPVACAFDSAPTEKEAVEVAELIRSWALVAAQGGFARARGAPPSPWTGRLHSARIALEESTLTALLDLGSCPPQALAVLLSALEGERRDLRPIRRVAIGGRSDPS